MEKFSTCWADEDHAYLQVKPDKVAGRKDFCDTQDEKILTQVLNDYDLETKDFYRWETRYGNDELSALILKKSGHDLGRILSMEALERGGSGRICKLKIVGEKKTLTVGKELEIRKLLSESHLKSSSFDVDFVGDDLILRGKGWGHGVGLCQIGAAVMSSEGYDYRSILLHYYPESEIRRFGIEIYK